MAHDTLIIKSDLNASLDAVWKAISQKEDMDKWYFDIPDFKLEQGSVFHFEGGEAQDRFMHNCEILEIIPIKKLMYSWSYEGHTGHSIVTFELNSLGDKTRITLYHQGLETFVHPKLSRDKFEEGWKYIMHESLRAYVEEGRALRNW